MNTLITNNRHLDLGCGDHPRNPYDRTELFGTDIRALRSEKATIVAVNHAIEPLPFSDAYFASVSAFDFLEHVPRVVNGLAGETSFPFIDLMSEIHRVLVAGGRFYAVTPCFPSPKAFADPTHINFIADTTHEYFTGEENTGHLYGFKGKFRLLRAEWVLFDDVLKAKKDLPLHRKYRHWSKRLRGKLHHFLWEFEAVKGN
jgi:SAM-dependent methyltransferase